MNIYGYQLIFYTQLDSDDAFVFRTGFIVYDLEIDKHVVVLEALHDQIVHYHVMLVVV